jgi:hypothetical protein
MIMVLSRCSIIHPGAVPLGFLTITAPSGNIACFMLLEVISLPILLKKASISARQRASDTKGFSNISETASLVMSSWVGPSPPVVMIMSARLNAFLIHAIMRSRLSPTTV